MDPTSVTLWSEIEGAADCCPYGTSGTLRRFYVSQLYIVHDNSTYVSVVGGYVGRSPPTADDPYPES